MSNKVLEHMRKDLNTGLKRFGEYSFLDKGAYEVCDVDSSTELIRSLPAKEAALVLETFCKEGSFHQMYTQQLVCALDDWEELFDENADYSAFINCMYNAEDWNDV